MTRQTHDFSTWRGQDPELTCPPTVRATFRPHEMIHPVFVLELNSPAFLLLQELVEKAARDAGEDPSDELVALTEAFDAIGG